MGNPRIFHSLTPDRAGTRSRRTVLSLQIDSLQFNPFLLSYALRDTLREDEKYQRYIDKMSTVTTLLSELNNLVQESKRKHVELRHVSIYKSSPIAKACPKGKPHKLI